MVLVPVNPLAAAVFPIWAASGQALCPDVQGPYRPMSYVPPEVSPVMVSKVILVVLQGAARNTPQTVARFAVPPVVGVPDPLFNTVFHSQAYGPATTVESPTVPVPVAVG